MAESNMYDGPASQLAKFEEAPLSGSSCGSLARPACPWTRAAAGGPVGPRQGPRPRPLGSPSRPSGAQGKGRCAEAPAGVGPPLLAPPRCWPWPERARDPAAIHEPSRARPDGARRRPKRLGPPRLGSLGRSSARLGSARQSVATRPSSGEGVLLCAARSDVPQRFAKSRRPASQLRPALCATGPRVRSPRVQCVFVVLAVRLSRRPAAPATPGITERRRSRGERVCPLGFSSASAPDAASRQRNFMF